MKRFLSDNLAHPSVPFLCLLGSGILLCWSLPLHCSFWIDELLTAWVSADSLQNTLDRAARYQGQPPLFFSVVWFFRSLLGDAELVLRLPALFAAGLSLFLLYRVARLYCPGDVACFAPLFLLANDEFHKFAMSARPYTLALSMSLLCVLFVIRSQRDNSTTLLVIASVAMSISVFFHPVFILFAIVAALLLWVERSAARSYIRDLALSVTIVVLCIIPFLVQALWLFSRNETLYFASIPDATKFLKIVFSPFPVVAFLTAFICTAVFFKSFSLDYTKLPVKMLLVLVVWATIGPIIYAVHAQATGNSLFLPRIMFWRLPALALIVAVLMKQVQPVLVRNFACLLFAFLTVSVYSLRPWHFEEWRSTVTATTREPSKKTALFSGLIELELLDWIKDPGHQAYLAAPYSVYAPTYKNVLLLPRNPHDPEARNYIERTVIPALTDGDHLVLSRTFRQYDPRYGVHEKLKELFEEAGFELEAIQIEGLIHHYRLNKPS